MAASDSDGSQPDLYERSAGTTTQVSTNTAGTANGVSDVSFGGASADGSMVFFTTNESLAASDTDSGQRDVYERSAGTTTQVSTNTDGTANSGISHASFGGASDDGSKVFFTAQESLTATDADASKLDVYERSGDTTTLVSTNTANDANGANHASFTDASADGSIVFFETSESMAATDSDGVSDVYERSAGATTQVTTNTAGTANGNSGAFFLDASADGSKAFFFTREELAATDLPRLRSARHLRALRRRDDPGLDQQ